MAVAAVAVIAYVLICKPSYFEIPAKVLIFAG
jgi:hypothetical protein